ncbi:MAG: hypothetical protein AAGI71_08100 [Bacteroidota bacterium]
MVDHPLAGRLQALAVAAERWAKADHPARTTATDRALGAGPPFTEAGVAFALNRAMRGLTLEVLTTWAEPLRTAPTSAPEAHPGVGLVSANPAPLAALADTLAVVAAGVPAWLHPQADPGGLIRAFLAEAASMHDTLPAVHPWSRAVQPPVVVGTIDPEAPPQLAGHAQALMRPRPVTVAVLDGRESAQAMEGLAEDALLHDGQADENVRLVWAPADLAPDAVLQAFAEFRAVVPAHPALQGRLVMQQSLLEAMGQPHAYGEALEFLLSKGAPAFQRAGHLRWTPYDALAEVETWLRDAASKGPVTVVTTDRRLAVDGIAGRVCEPGHAHRRPVLAARPPEPVPVFLARVLAASAQG